MQKNYHKKNLIFLKKNCKTLIRNHRIIESVASVCGLLKEKIVSDDDPTCQKWADMYIIVNALRVKMKISYFTEF